MQNFWAALPKPFFCLAPLADVTDAALRRIVAKYGKPHVMYTEFVSADGLARAPEEGRRKLMADLLFSPEERPVVAQFFTATPAHMEAAAALAGELGFDGVDINMGCPADGVLWQGAGANLINTPTLAVELVAAAKQGAPNLPVSVKTRLGYNHDVLEEWLPALLKAKPAAVALHARTKKEMSKVPAHWDRVKRAVEIRNEMGSDTLIVGNGDVKSVKEATHKAEMSGCDGVMMGRGIFGKPGLFSNSAEDWNKEKILQVAIEHAKLYEELLGDIKNFTPMQKSLTSGYCHGFPGAKELRVELMAVKSAGEAEEIISRFLQK